MQILNVRLGLATNSSSSHSLIFLKEGNSATDYPGHREIDGMPGYFGREKFTLASTEQKLRYLGIFLRDRLSSVLPENIASLIRHHWLDGVTVDAEDCVDHQSWYALPYQFGTKVPDEQFFRALKEYFLSDRLVILGGSDESSLDHPLEDGSGFTLPLHKDCGYSSPYVCRHDQASNYWTIFSPDDGTKIRFRLTPGSAEFGPVPDKASAPELADIKITDFCPYGCEYCYQSSTTKGKHAEYFDVYSVAEALAKLKTFEVAIGGGEPTLHPDFVRILEKFRSEGVVPNFTTRNMNWLRDPKKFAPIMAACGAFALSVDSEFEVRELATLLDYGGIDHARANLHLVMGTMDKWKFSRMLTVASELNIRTTLLGYKNVGFGPNVTQIPHDWWLDVVKEHVGERRYGADVSVDTVLASQYRQQILDSGVPEFLITFKDGKFSCYIDAVAMKVGPSSYCDEAEMSTLETEDWDYGMDRMISDAFAHY